MERKICFIVNGYPTKDDPQYAFIRPVVLSFADMGYKCTVIAPQSISRIAKKVKGKRPISWYDTSKSGNKVQILQPRYISFSNLKIFNVSISQLFFRIAIRKIIADKGIQPDFIYAHFWGCAINAAIATNNKIPIIAVSGESEISVYEYFSQKEVDNSLNAVKGVICVSSKNLDESRRLGLLALNPSYIVLPNAVDPALFYNIPKDQARAKLNIDSNATIGVFVGALIDRKGPNRVIEAAKSVEGLKLIIIGKGPLDVESESVLIHTVVPHDELGIYLNAADFFVLPTLAEGCCNSIIEGMACGLPIISSNLSFNDDILNKEYSIRVNPRDIQELSHAMSILVKNPQVRREMGEKASNAAQQLTIQARMNKMTRFIDNTLNQKSKW